MFFNSAKRDEFKLLIKGNFTRLKVAIISTLLGDGCLVLYSSERINFSIILHFVTFACETNLNDLDLNFYFIRFPQTGVFVVSSDVRDTFQ